MRAIQVTEYVKGPLDLKVSDNVPTPRPSATQYLIEIHSAGTNFFDLLQIQGKYQHQPALPWIGGAEFAGTVAAVPSSRPQGGSNPKYQVGDRVFGATQGAYATHVLAGEDTLLRVPAGWSFEDAAGLFVTAPTAYGGLVHRATVRSGEWVLVHAAAGGVGLSAVQIAKAMGATVVATAGTERKRQIAREFGADYVVDYRDAAWPGEVKTLCARHRTGDGRAGVDIVYDPVGMIEASLKCVAWNARLLVVGFAAGTIEKVALNRVLLKNVSLVGLHWGQYARFEKETVGVVWQGIFDLVAQGKFRGIAFTDESFVGLESVPRALQALGGRETWGKVVVKVIDDHAGQSKL
ncbi:alcohol dehydrogenase, zinc-containing [Aspergillus rambellii]|uniref:Alcohol dehydrogenase, zinc-containing n=2 Tax=Aspergillus subgen. Nidulantes TaxID=2720870 RepID=A0A0F8UYS0_9EURO|nr:alcohol dehydrogenase, zinc-containing [Aspergillus rambellii]